MVENLIISPHMIRHSLDIYHELWTLFLATYSGQLDNHPKSRLLEVFCRHPLVFPKIVRDQPIPGGRTVSTNASAGGYAVVISQEVMERQPVKISHLTFILIVCMLHKF